MISAAPLRSGVRRRWLLLPGVATFLLVGCASPARQILTSANAYHWHHARYGEACQTTSEACQTRASVLTRWHTALGEANAALQRGGKLPLQLGALKRVEKEAKKWTP